MTKHIQTTRREKSVKGFINRNNLNMNVNIYEWILESSMRMGNTGFVPRKWLAEAYGLLDAVRHVGPRRRAEM